MAEGDKVKEGFNRKDQGSTSSVLCTLFLFSALMFIVPIASYFATIYLFEKYFDIPQSESYIYAVIVSVIAVHLIVAGYIYLAFKEDKPPKQD